MTDYIVGAVADFPVGDLDQATSAMVKMYLNSSTVAQQTTASLETGNVNVGTSRFIIGSGNDTAARPFKGLISEVIIFDRALKKEEAQSVMKYLQKKYGIKDSSIAPDL